MALVGSGPGGANKFSADYVEPAASTPAPKKTCTPMGEYAPSQQENNQGVTQRITSQNQNPVTPAEPAHNPFLAFNKDMANNQPVEKPEPPRAEPEPVEKPEIKSPSVLPPVLQKTLNESKETDEVPEKGTVVKAIPVPAPVPVAALKPETPKKQTETAKTPPRGSSGSGRTAKRTMPKTRPVGNIGGKAAGRKSLGGLPGLGGRLPTGKAPRMGGGSSGRNWAGGLPGLSDPGTDRRKMGPQGKEVAQIPPASLKPTERVPESIPVSDTGDNKKDSPNGLLDLGGGSTDMSSQSTVPAFTPSSGGGGSSSTVTVAGFEKLLESMLMMQNNQLKMIAVLAEIRDIAIENSESGEVEEFLA